MIKFTNEEIEQMILFYKNGMSMVDIGKHFGVCNATIKNRLIAAGIEIRKYSTIEVQKMLNLKCVIVVKEFYLWKLFTRVPENLEEDLNVKSVVKTSMNLGTKDRKEENIGG